MNVRPFVRVLEEWCALWGERERKEVWRHADAGFTSGGEHTTLSAASLCRWDIRRGIGGRQDYTARIPIGVAEKQYVVHLWTLCQKVFGGPMHPHWV